MVTGFSRLVLGAAAGLVLPLAAVAGPFAPAAGLEGSSAIAMDDARFVGWATGISVARGPMDIANPQLGTASYGTPAKALGAADGSFDGVVSLGDGGTATLTFANAIIDGPGYDFAVFENGFADMYLELAFVEVSSNGTDFFRFDSVSLTPTDAQIGGFGTLDPTNLNNLAGKYRGGFGTPFDLSELAGVSPLLDVQNVAYVRIVDVVGSIDDAYATYDSLGHKVNDPWQTASSGCGLDLEAVGVLNATPEPGSLLAIALGVPMVCARRRR